MVQENETKGLEQPRSLSLDGLRTFVEIYETGSFRKAAERVYRSPSAVSLHIAKLETALQTRLFERDARKVTLTEAGEVLLSQARRLLALQQETISLFHRSALSGELRVSAPHDLGISLLPRLLKELRATHPDIRVNVKLGSSLAVAKAVEAGDADLAFFNDVAGGIAPGQVLYEESMQWLMFDGGRAIESTPLALATAEPGCAWREAAISALQEAGRDYAIAYTSDTSMGQIAALRSDLAIAALPLSLKHNDLVVVPDTFNLPQLPSTQIRALGDGSELTEAVISLLLHKGAFV
jgi:DNA-binding transcriptional LysR family regulator